MDITVVLTLLTFVVSVGALMVFIWSLSKGLFGSSQEASKVIFASHEQGLVEEPSLSESKRSAFQAQMAQRGGTATPADHQELIDRIEADKSSAGPVLLCLSLSVIWLFWASVAGMIASVKLHWPDLWVNAEWLTFGRIRPVHLNLVGYGWCSFAGVGIALWLIPRLLKVPLQGAKYAYWGAAIWHLGLTLGIAAILFGFSEGLEWLEIPWQLDVLLFIGGGFLAIPLVLTLLKRRVDHLYVSVWYMGAALLWFPVLFGVANMPDVHFGVQQATMNWWYGHNALGLWFTPLGLAAAYYFIPKVIGKPIHSYNLSLLGFWSLAFFYSQVGGHHLIGGPVPSWFITLGIVQSVMMVIPVLAVAINQHMTVLGSFSALRHSPTLRFIVLGTMMYTLASVQGSIESLRAVNLITHFTHYTVAHAHLGLYGFFSFIMFGSIYFVMPRVTQWEWPFPRLIELHFWLVTSGIAIYFVGLSIGGWLQGLILTDGAKPFMESVFVTMPYLKSRSLGGGLMTLGHLVFAVHFFAMAFRFGPSRTSQAVLGDTRLLDWMKLNKRAVA